MPRFVSNRGIYGAINLRSGPILASLLRSVMSALANFAFSARKVYHRNRRKQNPVAGYEAIDWLINFVWEVLSFSFKIISVWFCFVVCPEWLSENQFPRRDRRGCGKPSVPREVHTGCQMTWEEVCIRSFVVRVRVRSFLLLYNCIVKLYRIGSQ